MLTLKVKIQLSWYGPLAWLRLRIRLSQSSIAGLSKGSSSTGSSTMWTNLLDRRNLPIQANLKIRAAVSYLHSTSSPLASHFPPFAEFELKCLTNSGCQSCETRYLHKFTSVSWLFLDFFIVGWVLQSKQRFAMANLKKH